jgi:hypothetical protein
MEKKRLEGVKVTQVVQVFSLEETLADENGNYLLLIYQLVSIKFIH